MLRRLVLGVDLWLLCRVTIYVMRNLKSQLAQIPYATVTRPLLYVKGRAAP